MGVSGVVATFTWSVGLANPGGSAVLSDGSTVTAAVVNEGRDGSAIVAQHFSAQGAALGQPVRVVGPQTNIGGSIGVSPLANGAYAVVFSYGRRYPLVAAIAWQGVAADGSLLLPKPMFIDTTAPDQPQPLPLPVVLQAAGGGVAEFTTQILAHGVPAVVRRVYQLSGEAGPAENVSPVPGSGVGAFTVAPLSNGEVMVGVVANPAGTSMTVLQTRVFTASGQAAGPAATLVRDARNSALQNFVLLPDQTGHAVASWTNVADASFTSVPVGVEGALAPRRTVQALSVLGYALPFNPICVLSDGQLVVNQVTNSADGFASHALVMGAGSAQPHSIEVAPGTFLKGVCAAGEIAQFSFNDTHGGLYTETVQYGSGPAGVAR